MKKVFSYILIVVTILFVFASCGATSANKFKDVKKTDWFYEDVNRACELNLINGRSETEFAPEEKLTYAEAVKLAACMHQVYTKDEPLVMNGESWYQVYVDYCREKKIIEKEYPWGESISRGAYMDVFSRALPSAALPVINTVDDGMIPDVAMTHPYAKSIYMLYRAGIVCGQDDEGNCVPDSFVKRSEVAAILTRMMDETMRVSITLEDPEKIVTGGGSSSSGKTPGKKPSEDEEDNEDSENTELPWETGGKKPSKYTWSEFLALSEFQKQAFIDSFADVDAFETWMTKAQKDEANAKMPWEKGGKKPSKYTWDEFEALDDLQKEAFVESFGSNESFEAWMEKAKNAESTDKMPWENGGKQPQSYTWAEFEALTADQKEAFIESFGSDDAFEIWMQGAQGTGNEEMPWEKGGKQPQAYTWDEFENLTDIQKEAFVESFGSNEAFEAWMESAQQ